MATKQDPKAKATPKAKGTDVSVKVDAVESPEIMAARQAVIAAGVTLDNTERASASALFTAHRAFGDAVRTLAVAMAKASGDKAPKLSDWSDIRKALAPNGAKVGTLSLAGRSEASVQRSVKVSLYFPNDAAIDAYMTTRDAVLAKASDPKATPAAKDIAKASAYATGGIVGLVSYGEAKAKGRLNTRTGAITAGSNRAPTPEVTARNLRVEELTADAATLRDDSQDASDRDLAAASVVVPGITVGMLASLSEADLRVLSGVALDMAKAKAKAPKAKATPVANVLDTTGQAPAAPDASDPLAGVSPDTLASLAKLMAAAMASAS